MKAVLFDLDGTLVDTAPDLAAALNHVVVEEGMPPLTLETIRPHVSRGGLALTLLAFENQRQANEIEPLRLRLLDHYQQHIADHSRLFDGFENVLNRLDESNTPWGIVTNKPEGLTELLLTALQLKHRSAVTIAGDTLAHKKPHPLPLQVAARTINIPCQDCIYIGDDVRDIEAGNAANMTTVIARYGYINDSSDLTGWLADDIIDRPEQILKLLQLTPVL